MTKMRFAAAFVLALAATSAASAADLNSPLYKAPMSAASSWTGCYAGANVGWGWGRSSFSDHTADNAFEANGVNLTGGMIDSAARERSVDVDQGGILFGGQLGCDYQFSGNIVVGISGSVAGADVNGTTVDPYSQLVSAAPSNGEITAKTDFLADVSGRLGFTWAQALIYGKGGVAWAHNTYVADTCYCSGESAGAFSGSDTATGGVAGGGIEWAFLPNWSAFAEYDHYFFAVRTVHFTAPNVGFGVAPLTAAVDVKQSLDTVKVGVNYRFYY